MHLIGSFLLANRMKSECLYFNNLVLDMNVVLVGDLWESVLHFIKIMLRVSH